MNCELQITKHKFDEVNYDKIYDDTQWILDHFGVNLSNYQV